MIDVVVYAQMLILLFRRDEGLGYGIYVVYALVMGGLAQFSGL